MPFPLRFLFASNPKAMTGALGIVYRAISTHLAHITHYQDQPFTPLAFGSATPDGAGVITDAVVDGSTTAVLSIPYDDAQPDPEIFIWVRMYQLARYGGTVDSQNTLHVTLFPTTAMEPDTFFIGFGQLRFPGAHSGKHS